MHDSTSREINNKKQSKKGNGTLKTTKIKNSVAQVDREQNSTNLARLDFYFYSYLRTPLFIFFEDIYTRDDVGHGESCMRCRRAAALHYASDCTQLTVHCLSSGQLVCGLYTFHYNFKTFWLCE